MTLRLTFALLFAVAAAPPSTAAAQITDAPTDTDAPAWQGQMQCAVTWTDPADAERAWLLSVSSDTSNMKLALSDRTRPGDPAPLKKDETRELKPRKAKLEIAGLGGGEVEVTSYPIGEGRMWHDIGLGHVENLDKLPADPTLVLTFDGAKPLNMAMRDFDRARAYLKRCLAR